jgi:hypothetical protein
VVNGNTNSDTSPTDVFIISGSPTRRVKVTAIWISPEQQTISGINTWSLIYRNTANFGGTFQPSLAVNLDGNDRRTQTAVAGTYSANPMILGNAFATVWTAHVVSSRVDAAQPGRDKMFGTYVNFVQLYGKPFVLDGPQDSLCWNMGGVAYVNGTSPVIIAGASWYEV